MDHRLTLPEDEMRRLGYAVVDRLVAHAAGLRDLPPVRPGNAAELMAALGGPPPDGPGDLETELSRLIDDVIPYGQRGDHPRLFARIPGPSNYVSALADAIGAGFNVFAGSWTGGSGPATVELVVLDWLRGWCGLPEGTEGVLTSGGSVANLLGLAAARSARPGGVAYTSSEGHAALTRAASVLGVEARVLPAGDDLRLPPAALREALAADLEAGLRPFCVMATAGTTSSGAVDPLRELAGICREHGLWLHVDGAYGAAALCAPSARGRFAGIEHVDSLIVDPHKWLFAPFDSCALLYRDPAALTERGRAALEGLELADSLVLDPHKWLFQPYEIGCLLVREPGALGRAFALDGPYLRDTAGGAVDFRDRGLQLTRGGRALKLYLSLRVFGLDAFRSAIEHGIDLAEHAEATLRARDGWEISTPAQLGIVTFRRDGDDARQTAIAAAMVREGYAAPSTTVVRRRVALRLCTINPRTTRGEIEETIRRMER
jgi:aromatic-L-amino-acid decarboxylase